MISEALKKRYMILVLKGIVMILLGYRGGKDIDSYEKDVTDTIERLGK